MAQFHHVQTSPAPTSTYRKIDHHPIQVQFILYANSRNLHQEMSRYTFANTNKIFFQGTYYFLFKIISNGKIKEKRTSWRNIYIKTGESLLQKICQLAFRRKICFEQVRIVNMESPRLDDPIQQTEVSHFLFHFLILKEHDLVLHKTQK